MPILAYCQDAYTSSSRCPAARRFACIIQEGNWQQSLSECHFYAHQQCVPFVAPPRAPKHAAGTVDSVERCAGVADDGLLACLNKRFSLGQNSIWSSSSAAKRDQEVLISHCGPISLWGEDLISLRFATHNRGDRRDVIEGTKS